MYHRLDPTTKPYKHWALILLFMCFGAWALLFLLILSVLGVPF